MIKLLSVFHGSGTIIVTCPLCGHDASIVRNKRGRYCANRAPCKHLSVDKDKVDFTFYIESDIVIKELVVKER